MRSVAAPRSSHDVGGARRTAQRLDALRAFPGNHLEALGGDRRGQNSIRMDNQETRREKSIGH